MCQFISQLVGWSVFHDFLNGEKFHFHVPKSAVDFYTVNNDFIVNEIIMFLMITCKLGYSDLVGRKCLEMK